MSFVAEDKDRVIGKGVERRVYRGKPEVIADGVDVVVTVRTLLPRYSIEKRFLSMLGVDAASEMSRLS